MNIASVGHSFVPQTYVNRAEQDEADKLGSEQSHAEAALSLEQIKEIEQLKARDREVRAHEMAHLAAAGGLAMSGASFTYQRGADGVNYAVGGEVKIDTSSASTPEQTMRKAQKIRAAALAPAQPSNQDFAVAAKAAQMAAEARAEQATADCEDEQQADKEESVQNSTMGKAATQQYASVAAEFKNDSQLKVSA